MKLHSGLPDGTFTVTYQVVSADSHPVSGAFTFSIGAPSTTSVSVSDQEAGGGVVGGLYGFARYLSYAGFILLVGGAAFVLACWQRGTGERSVQRLVVSGWLALTGATLAMLLLRGSYTGSGKVADIFDLTLLSKCCRPRRARHWSRDCCCSPRAPCSSPSSSGRTKSARTRRRRAI